MSWNDLISAAKQGKLPDVEFESKEAAVKLKPDNTYGLFGEVSRETDRLLTAMSKIAEEKAADEWFHKQALIDASQMGGGGMPPPPGGMPMDPAMGGMPPDPMMMDPAMMGGAPPGMPMDPAMGGMPPMPPPMPVDPAAAEGKPQKEKIDVIVMRETGRIKEMLNALFNHLDIPIPPSVVDAAEMSRAIVEQQKRDSEKQQLEEEVGIPGTNVMPIPPMDMKIGQFDEETKDAQLKLAAILRNMK